jgi:hypothetical protein
MARGSLVAVSYPVDGEFAQVNTSVLDDLAEVAFLDGRPYAEIRDILAQADVLIGWHLSQELPAGALRASPGLRLIQLLSAGADSVDFAAIPERLTLASNVGAYAEPRAEYIMAMALARGPQQRIDRPADLVALLVAVHADRVRAVPVIAVGEHVVVPGPQPLTQRRFRSTASAQAENVTGIWYRSISRHSRQIPTRLPYSMCVSVPISRMSGPYWNEYSPQVSLTPSSLSEYSPPSS